MEKRAIIAKSKIKFLMFLHNHPLISPGKATTNNNKLKSHQNKGFSGPITSVALREARNRSKNSSSLDEKEPTSPKISCMGQIKHKKKICCKNKNSSSAAILEQKKKKEKKESANSRGNFFNGGKQGRKSDASSERSKSFPDKEVPNLGDTKRFASGRNSLSSFDWTAAQVAHADEEPENRSYSSDEDEVIIPFSAPILLGGEVGPAAAVTLEPRKEINLWKRRTMAQPIPLQLNIW